MSIFNKIGEKGRTGSAWKRRAEGEREGMAEVGRNGPNHVCTYEYMNKEKQKEVLVCNY
jgi:hypothetical protein